jgi:hypothetical protein
MPGIRRTDGGRRCDLLECYVRVGRLFHRVDRSGPRLRAGDAMFVFADAPSTSRSPVSRGLQGLGEAGGSEVGSDRILQQLDNLR